MVFIGLVTLLPAQAHETRPAYLQLEAAGTHAFDVFWKMPAGGIAETIALALVFPEDCKEVTPRVPMRHRDERSETWTLQCERPLAGRTIAIDGLQSTRMNVLLRLKSEDETSQSLLLSPDNRTGTFAATPSRMDVVKSYFVLGVEHIWFGLDHLLFVLTLLLLADGWRRLLALITAFTVAHSITLSLASLGLVTVPIGPVEALIAFSIVLAASEGLKSEKDRTSLMARVPWIVAFSFGLLHGFGFAGALAEIGLPPTEIPLSLLFFNVGVEAGQIAFVAIVILAVRCFELVAGRTALGLVTRGAAYGAGSIAAFWFIERVGSLIA